jgi:hypothetical protein
MPNIPKDYRRLEGSELKPGHRAQLLGLATDTQTLTIAIVLYSP